MFMQVIDSAPAFLFRVQGDRLAITPLVDGVPGDVYLDRQHTIGGSEINDSHFAAGSAESERAALGIYPVTPAASFDSDRYSSTGKTYTFDTPDGIEAHTLAEHSIADLRARKVAVLEAEYEAASDAGFSSDTLGTTHTYGSSDRQVIDLFGAVLEGRASIGFGCKDASQARVRPTHTAAQLQAVLTAAVTKKAAFHETLYTKLDAIEAADDYATLNAITWSF